MVPSFKYYFFPFLDFLNEQKDFCQLSEIGKKIAFALNLTDADLSEPTKGGKLTRHLSRVNYCAAYLKKMMLVKTIASGKYIITQRGKDVLKQFGTSLSLNDLRSLPEFYSSQNPSNTNIVFVKPHMRGSKMINGYFCNKKMLKPNNPNIES